MYTDDFKKFVRDGVKNSYHIGTGNPNAQLLFIGKESAIADGNIEGRALYDNNALEWQEHIEKNTCQKLHYQFMKIMFLGSGRVGVKILGASIKS